MTMQRALSSGLSGIRANQQYLDVIGTNLANVNTQGYKSSRVTFTNLFAQNLRSGTGPTNGRGGVNSAQVGTGVQVGSVDLNFVQGSLVATGNELDLGIRGDGFFVLRENGRQYYTRVGAFGLDEGNRLVDLRTGFRVQSTASEDIEIVRNSLLLGEATSEISLTGSLPSRRNGPLTELLRSDRAFQDLQPAEVTGTNAATVDLTAAGTTLRLRVNNGATQSIDLSALIPQNAATLADIATAIDAQATGLSAAVEGGSLVLRSDSTGTSSSIFLENNPLSTALFTAANAGRTSRGSESVATATTLLNDLGANTDDYVAGDQLVINGMYPDGTPVQAIFTYGSGAGEDGTTLGDLVTFLDNLFSAGADRTASVSLNSDGLIEFTADESGDAMMSITIDDGAGASGATNWSSHFFRTIVQGTGKDTFRQTATVFDSMGTRRQIELNFERQDDGSWNIIPSVDEAAGTVNSGTITGITFDQNGRLSKIPDTSVQITWNDVPGLQELRLDLGTAGTGEGLVMTGLSSEASLQSRGDGFEAGTLANVRVRSDGVIEGEYTNNQTRELAQLAVALFTNNQGLDDLGDGLYGVGPNSGDSEMTIAQVGAAGSIQSNSIEASNVDIAAEFVRLIEAQRAFQASARVVSTSDEVLTELVNIVN